MAGLTIAGPVRAVADPHRVAAHLRRLHIGHGQHGVGCVGNQFTIKHPLIKQGLSAGGEDGEGHVGPRRNRLADRLLENARHFGNVWVQIPTQDDVARRPAKAIDGDQILGSADRIENHFAGVEAAAIIVAGHSTEVSQVQGSAWNAIGVNRQQRVEAAAARAEPRHPIGWGLPGVPD